MQYNISGNEITCDFTGVSFIQKVHELTGEDWLAEFVTVIDVKKLSNVAKYVFAAYVSNEKMNDRSPSLQLEEFEKHFATVPAASTLVILRNIFTEYSKPFAQAVEALKDDTQGEAKTQETANP